MKGDSTLAMHKCGVGTRLRHNRLNPSKKHKKLYCCKCKKLCNIEEFTIKRMKRRRY